MGMLLWRNWKAERYERIGLENPIVGMASSWKRIRLFGYDKCKKGKA